MSLAVVGSINQSNYVGLYRSPQVVYIGLCRSLQVSMGGQHRFLMPMTLLVVVGSINQTKSVPLMSLAEVGSISQSNSAGLHGSPWVVYMCSLHRSFIAIGCL